uniref:Uncharacterized protein n=1 Tax=Setaria italica TaxID=4555 RepID=K3Z1K2_SETIT
MASMMRRSEALQTLCASFKIKLRCKTAHSSQQN